MIKITQIFSIFDEYREHVLFNDIEITFDLCAGVWNYIYLQQLTDILNCTKNYNFTSKEYESQKQILRDALIFKLQSVSFILYTIEPAEVLKIERKIKKMNESECAKNE